MSVYTSQWWQRQALQNILDTVPFGLLMAGLNQQSNEICRFIATHTVTDMNAKLLNKVSMHVAVNK